MARSVTIVGAGLAALRCAQALRDEGFRGAVEVVGDEPYPPYDRPPLSKQVLTGAWPLERVVLPGAAGLEVSWSLGVGARSLDVAARRLVLGDGSTREVDAVVIATGAAARRLPWAATVDGVHVLRTRDDAGRLGAALRTARRLIVVGAGFVGAEVASSAVRLGVEVVLIESAPAPLTRVFGAQVGAALGRLHERNGARLRCGVSVAEGVREDGRLRGVVLTDGTHVEADVVVAAVGAEPNTGWLAGSGVAVDDGVVCDSRCRVLDGAGAVVPGVLAAGDVARWPHRSTGGSVRLEHWTNAVEQAQYVARSLALGTGDEAPPYAPVPSVWSDQHGCRITFVGWAQPHGEVSVVAGSLDADRFLAVYRSDGRVTGAVGLGMPRETLAWQRRISNAR